MGDTNRPSDRGDLWATEIKKFSWKVALALALAVLMPSILAFALSSPQFYIGHHLNVDDHMVYAAWMKQAAEGRFLFDNRFATEAQPGLTIHVYFLVLGWISALLGAGLTTTLARVGFTILFVLLLGKFLSRMNLSPLATRVSLVLACVGAGFGFLIWQPFGNEYVDKQSLGAGLFGGWVPVDVWQPEVFVLPSMLTNSLFMVSLCLIVVVLQAVVDARESWKPVLPGALAMLVLMNIHSYDVLLLALVLVGFLVASVVAKEATGQWVTRAVVIGLGAVPSALWFLYVLSRDPVFRERAATLTFSPTFQQLVGGILPLVVLAGFAIANRIPSAEEDAKTRTRMSVGAWGLLALIVGLFLGASGANPGAYFLTPVGFAAVLVGAVVVVGLLAKKEWGWNLLIAWAVIGLVAPYFPGLFQRKLAMALAIPWAILAAIGLVSILERKVKESQRNTAVCLAVALLSLTSFFWVQRELLLIRNNVSSTTVHAIFYSPEVNEIIKTLDREQGRVVVLAPPGVPQKSETGLPFTTPLMPDINPVLSGLSGAYSYAGHWSETPNYQAKRQALAGFFFSEVQSDDAKLLRESGATHIVTWIPGLGLRDMTSLGEVVYQGQQWMLIRVRK